MNAISCIKWNHFWKNIYSTTVFTFLSLSFLHKAVLNVYHIKSNLCTATYISLNALSNKFSRFQYFPVRSYLKLEVTAHGAWYRKSHLCDSAVRSEDLICKQSNILEFCLVIIFTTVIKPKALYAFSLIKSSHLKKYILNHVWHQFDCYNKWTMSTFLDFWIYLYRKVQVRIVNIVFGLQIANR